MMSEFPNNPAKSTDPEVLRKYFLDLGFTLEEAEPMIRNWSRTNPQTMEEVREGVLVERERRLDSSQRWVDELNQVGGEDIDNKGD
ncbi:MAG: hypothetical protein ABII80_01370 [bacterium]